MPNNNLKVMLNLEYYNETKLKISGDFLERLLDSINSDFQDIFPKEIDLKKNYFITCTLIQDDLMQKINKKERGIGKPTDVISLSYLGSEFPGQDISGDMIGEIFISVDTAKKQAQEANHDLETELKFLFVHGVLHILGYEHESEHNFQTMMELTNQILLK